jgi:hypothetical protein
MGYWSRQDSPTTTLNTLRTTNRGAKIADAENDRESQNGLVVSRAIAQGYETVGINSEGQLNQY